MTQETKLFLTIVGCVGFLIGYFISPLVYVDLKEAMQGEKTRCVTDYEPDWETVWFSDFSDYLCREPKPAVFIPRAEAQKIKKVVEITGKASYYNRGICDLHGTVYGENCLTRNGEVFDDQEMVAACPRKLLNKYIIVTHKDKSIIVRCIDTGSFGEKYNRVLDLSQGAFEQLAPASKGVIDVSYSLEG